MPGEAVKMKALKNILCVTLAALTLTACGTPAAAPEAPADSAAAPETTAAPNTATDTNTAAEPVRFTDALDYEVELESWERVVSLYGSFAETWLLAGGELVGTTSDAVTERDLALGGDVAIVGTVKEPNLEEVIAAEPDFVILAADIAPQVDFHAALTEVGIPHAYYRTDTFDEYLEVLGQFCELTGRQDLYEQNGLAVKAQIDAVLEAVEGQRAPTALLIRAFSTGAKAKGDDNLAGVMLRDLGADNLVSRYESLLEEISMEEIIAADPEFILITTMGASDQAAMDYMAATFESDPAWAGLTAVKNGHYLLLPRELFHYKPNARWGESYEYLANVLYPELALG